MNPMTPRPATQRVPLQAEATEASPAGAPAEMTLHLLPPREAEPVVPPMRSSRVSLALEFVLLFVAIPLALGLRLIRHFPPMPILWAVAAYCLVALLRDPAFDRRQLWNAAPLRRQLLPILALWVAGAVVITVLIRVYAADLLLALPRKQPGFWASVLVLYPMISVYPQALIYRAFLFHRYAPLVDAPQPTRTWLLILVSAATFSLMHLVFRNWIAVALTFPGGILFARRYLDTRSLCISWFEHALYGCFLFTIGLGPYFCVRFV